MEYLRVPISDSVNLDFVCIPTGDFLMGNNKIDNDFSTQDVETPQHRVFLTKFHIGKFPVTNLHYQLFTQETGYRFPIHFNDGKIPAGKENHPVINVSLKDANEFCRWVSETTKLNVQLPSEAQWEKAARGADGRRYPWGENFPDKDLLNFNYFIRDTTEVDKYPKGVSGFGVYDMAGNAWEWTIDLFDAYPGSKNKISPYWFPGSYVIRGGSFATPPNGVRCARREAMVPENTEPHLGFRCVCL